MEGFGRGGRGAALLKAQKELSQRKPGEQESGSDGSNDSPAPSVVVSSSQLSLGRGQMMETLLQGQQQMQGTPARGSVPSPASPQAVGARPTAPVVVPLGRGLSALRALLSTSAGAPGAPAIPQGRGVFQALSSQAAAAVSPGQEVSPTPPGVSPQRPSGPPQPPTQALAEMSVTPRSKPVVMRGNDGKPVSLSANYIRLNAEHHHVYQYHVTFNPVVDSKKLRYALLKDHREMLGPRVFDGSMLFLPKKLEKKETVLKSVRKTGGDEVWITVTFIKVVPPEHCTHLYNILFRRIQSKLKMVQVGRYYYNPNTPISIPQHKLEVWPGYITAIQEYEGGLMFMLDSSHRVLRTETVLDIMHQTLQRNRRGFQDEILRRVVGCIVLTRYNNKTYRVDDIIWDKNPTHTFAKPDGQISFVEYYKKAYSIDINDYEQPLLLHKPKPTKESDGRERTDMICLIPELSYVTGLTDEIRKDNLVMKDVTSHTRVTPEQRDHAFRTFINNLVSVPEAHQELLDWGLQIERECIQIDGRQVMPEEVFGGQQRRYNVTNASWSGDACRKRVLVPVALKNWAVFYTHDKRGQASSFVETVLQQANPMGISMARPDMVELRDDRTETYIKFIKQKITPDLQMVVIIFPTRRDDRYSSVKKLCCVECPIPSQVIIARTLAPNKLKSVCQKIALQMNCKLGGELWAVDIPFNELMIVGIDVYHDASSKKRSIAGFVASTNRHCTRWFSRVAIQLPGQELMDALRICLSASLKKYHELNHRLPSRIVVYRDGVGDGQLDMVRDYEVQQLEACFSSFDAKYSPHLSVVVVQKRINTRLFLREQAGPRVMLKNPFPGTVVDHTITRRDRYDFFLVSQYISQGTVSPTHYVVVHDGSQMKPDYMQRLAYKMTHLYYNWPGTVRVPAPCQYAHKLAYLVGQHIHREPSVLLSDRLFFL